MITLLLFLCMEISIRINVTDVFIYFSTNQLSQNRSWTDSLNENKIQTKMMWKLSQNGEMPRLDVAGSQRRSKSEIDWFKKFPAGQTLFGKAESADQKLRGGCIQWDRRAGLPDHPSISRDCHRRGEEKKKQRLTRHVLLGIMRSHWVELRCPVLTYSTLLCSVLLRRSSASSLFFHLFVSASLTKA